MPPTPLNPLEEQLETQAPLWLKPLMVARLEFLSYLDVQRQLSRHTLRAYQNDSLDFMVWVMQNFLAQSPNKTTLRDLPAQYLGYLARQSLSRSTLARKSSSLRSFLKYVMKEEFYPLSTFNLRFHQPRLPQTLPHFLSKETIDELIEMSPQLEKTAYAGLRNQLIVKLLFSSGIRVAELVGLDVQAINREEGELKVVGKGNRERIAFCSADFLTSLEAWLPLREALVQSLPSKNKKQNALFLNQRGQRLSDRSVHRLLADLGKAAGMEAPLHPHLFRHSFATHLLNNGVELRLVQELLGHVSIRSTQIYTHINTDRLRHAYLQAHPRAKKL